MDTPVNEEQPSPTRRATDLPSVAPILLNVPESVVRTLDFNYIPSDLRDIIKIYQNIRGDQKRAYLFQSIVEHQNITSETLQALFFGTKIDAERSIISNVLFEKYPDDTEASVFLLSHGRRYIKIQALTDLKARYSHLIKNDSYPISPNQVN